MTAPRETQIEPKRHNKKEADGQRHLKEGQRKSNGGFRAGLGDARQNGIGMECTRKKDKKINIIVINNINIFFKLKNVIQ